MRNTKSQRTCASAGSSAVPTIASAAEITVESPGTSKRSALPVAWASFNPVRMSAVVVSNAAVPGRPAVSFAGNVSLMNCQMSADTEPRFTVDPAFACPGTPGLSTNATDTLSKYIPSFELQPSEMAKRKHCCVTPSSTWIESGTPVGLEVLSGKPSPANGSKSVKHCGSGLKMMKPGYWRLPHSFPPFNDTFG